MKDVDYGPVIATAIVLVVLAVARWAINRAARRHQPGITPLRRRQIETVIRDNRRTR